MATMNALNRAFEKAFAHTATRETLMDLLACLGEELACERIAIFELNMDETFDNTYEWCRPGILREKELLQGIPVYELDSWRERLIRDEILMIRDLDEIRETDGDVYELFHAQKVRSAIVSKLAFHGKGLGFFILENPSAETMEEVDLVLPGMRYILSSLVYSDSLVRRLERIGYTDRLTGTGNRVSLQDYLENLDEKASLGLLYCEVLGWRVEDHRLEHMKEEQKLLHTGQVLSDIYGDEIVFRVGGKEFLVLLSRESCKAFEDSLRLAEHMFEENDLLVAMGSLWREDAQEGAEALIRQVHMLEYSHREELLENQAKTAPKAAILEPESSDKANITLPRQDEFFRQAEDFLAGIFDEPILTAVVDVNYFKLYNDIFGRKAGSRLLEEIADSLEAEAHRLGGIAGYLGGDNFCLMAPVPAAEQEKLRPFIDRMFHDLKYADGFTPAMGIYISYDRQETMITMYDRALTPLSEIKGSYMEHYRFYDAGHFQHLREDKILLMDIRQGIPRGEFIFYLQPQVHERTGKVVGCEALVRWCKNGQVIPPSRFVPLLEKTGYIFAVDCYVWEETVKWLRSLLDRGLNPVPCSVNVSRVDFYFTDVAQFFINLVKKYDIPSRLLGIEITESAFTDNTDAILDAVKTLHEAGFRLLMDDFGSGSSSLSMLHTLHLDVLKTDVRFMSKKSADSRAVSIVESVISMAHMIGMLVVTEGVETEEQRDNLIALGDNYAQGFYFYRPMPVQDFETILADPDRIGQPPAISTGDNANHIGFRNLIREGMVSDTLLDNIIGPAAVYRESGGVIRLLQANDQYLDMAGFAPGETGGLEKVINDLQKEEKEDFMRIVRRVDSHPMEGSAGEVYLPQKDGGRLCLDMRFFLLYACDAYKLYLSVLQEHKK